MLERLSIKNYALIESLEMTFSEGLNIITGETGAGKSVIIDSIMKLLGSRASSSLVRDGTNKAIIEGKFKLRKNHPVFEILKKYDYETDGEDLIITRIINSGGNSRCFINDVPAQVSTLKEVGNLLADFHGQHDHQLLLNKEIHIDILDSTGKYQNVIEKHLSEFINQKELIEKLSGMRKKAKELEQQQEFLLHQLSEIEKVNPLTDEDKQIEQELKILENIEFLKSSTNEIFETLYNSGDSVHGSLYSVLDILKKLNEIDDSFNPYPDEINSAIASVAETAKFSQSYFSGLDFDTERIEFLRERSGKLNILVKKFGSVNKAIERAEEIRKNIKLVTNFDSEIKQLQKKITDSAASLGILSDKLTDERKKAAVKLSSSVQKTLKEIGIGSPQFEINFNKKITDDSFYYKSVIAAGKSGMAEANEKGCDIVEFYISTNKGEKPKPLAEIASGGEISRIMLALKSLASEVKTLPIFIFDEIDSGISGSTARKVGRKMLELGGKNQILAITHLPQIASLGKRNIRVRKTESDKRTVIKAEILNTNTKLLEISRLISGGGSSENANKLAKELIEFN